MLSAGRWFFNLALPWMQAHLRWPGGAMALILVVARGRLKKTLFNVGFILSEMKSGRPAYLAKEELDVKNPRALGLPHGAVIAVGTLFFLAVTAHFTK